MTIINTDFISLNPLQRYLSCYAFKRTAAILLSIKPRYLSKTLDLDGHAGHEKLQ